MTQVNPEDFLTISQRIGDIYVELEGTIFESIAKRLAVNPELAGDYVGMWQVQKLQELQALNTETIEMLAETTGVAREAILALFEEIIGGTISDVDNELEAIGLNALGTPSNLQELLNSYVEQVFEELDNLVNQTLITTAVGTGTVAIAYRNIVERTTAQVLAGNMTINQAMTQTVIDFRQQGLKSGFRDRSGRQWSVEPYVNTVIRSTVNNTYDNLRTSRMQEYGVEFVRVSTHGAARPICARCQGTVLSMNAVSSDAQYKSVYDFEFRQPRGLRGINCAHILYPFIPELNTNNETPPTVEYADERYALTQKQRQLERNIRKSKEALRLAETTGDTTAIDKYKKQIRDRQATLRVFISENGLPRQRNREQIV